MKFVIRKSDNTQVAVTPTGGITAISNTGAVTLGGTPTFSSVEAGTLLVTSAATIPVLYVPIIGDIEAANWIIDMSSGALQTGAAEDRLNWNTRTLSGTWALGTPTVTTINGLTLTSSTGTITLTNAKTLAVTNTLTLSGTDGTTMTFPSTSATLARTDAANSFTGTQTFLGAISNTASGAAVTLSPSGSGTVAMSPGGAVTMAGSGLISLSPTGGAAVEIQPASGNVTIAPGGSGTITLTSNASGNINGMNIGATTTGTGYFSTARATSLALGGATIGSNALAVTGTIQLYTDATNNFTLSSASSSSTLTAARGIGLTAGSGWGINFQASGGITLGTTLVVMGGNEGQSNNATKKLGSVTAFTDATPKRACRITVPNGAHSAAVRVTIIGSLGAGGAIGANEATQTITYHVGIARTAGVAMNAVISTPYGDSGSVAVVGATTIAVTAAITLNAEGVSVSNTADVMVTITKGGGASANHTCRVLAEVVNANNTGVTISIP